jgi:hypothetical protein
VKLGLSSTTRRAVRVEASAAPSSGVVAHAERAVEAEPTQAEILAPASQVLLADVEESPHERQGARKRRKPRKK